MYKIVVCLLLFNNLKAQQIPPDKLVRTGKLVNGFTYYIRHNEEPQKRVELYLVNKVGSVLEDEDQRGLAHFMEHMNFNGTTHFPKNELVDHLQKAGVRFGADLNAYTTFDETVYQLPVPAPMLSDGLRIMRDWAQEATLDSAEIEKERGIVLEEERLGKGASERMARQFYPMMLNHSHYADRLPIGLDDVLMHFKPATIRRFHHDWYRPDLQALIVVGDVDVTQTEKMIREQFSDLKNPVNERTRTPYTVPLTGHNQFLTVTDKEAASATIEILIKHKAPVLATTADYLSFIKRTLFTQLIAARRYAEVSQESQPAYANMNAGIQPLLGGLDMFYFDVTPKAGQFQDGFEQAWTIIERIRRDGFTAAELERAKVNYSRSMQTTLNEKDKTSSVKFVKEYQNLFLHNEAAPGIEWEEQFTRAHINAITLADINALIKEYIRFTDMDLLVMAPDKTNLPDSVAVNKWLKNVTAKSLSAYKEDSTHLSLLPVKPSSGKVVDKSYLSALNITRLTLSNGVTVILKPTDFKNDEIRFNGFSSGGTSVYDDKDFDAAAAAPGLMSRFGSGDLNPVQLSNVLNGKVLNVSANILQRTQNISGVAAPADLETALQLAYLQFTHPRKDSILFKSIISSSKNNLLNRNADPGNVFSDTIASILGSYSYRASPPSPERLDKITLQRAYDIYRERFSDASGFTFVFVGKFTPENITPLLEQYLGSLPSSYKKEQARDLGIHIPSGRIVKKVMKGQENKALVRMIFSSDYTYSPFNNLLLKALGDILQIRLTQDLRENEGEVYSPSVQVQFNKYPKSRYALVVAFGCAPENTEHLAERVEQIMQEMSANGPSAENVEKFKAAYSKNMELVLKDNSFWLTYLSGQYENKEDPMQVMNIETLLQKIDVASLRDATDVFFSDKNRILFELLPE
jgi:zinc protease